MPSSRSPAAKDYVDRGVQTTPPSVKALWLTRSLSKTSSSRANNGSLSEYSGVVPTPTHSRSSTRLDGAYSHSLPPDSPSPVRFTTTTGRVHKRQQTPYSRPTSQSNKRVVSLPENPSLYNAKTLVELDSNTLRVVSLPHRLPSSFMENSLSSDSIAASLQTDHSFISGDNPYSRIRRRGPSSDSPHTPSPPSSPDSVLIIDDQDQLSETFLRGKCDSDSQRLSSDDEGWITWANSPPRPIPALHGPLSLPYARCPSGAEGTIIEENDNLPRMIWGLGADDAPSTHSRGSSHNPYHETPRMSFSHNSKVPPRLQKKQASSTQLATPQQTPTLSVEFRRGRKTQDGSHQRALENLGSRPRDNLSAITLNNMLSLGAAKVTGTWDSLYGNLAHQSQDPVVEGGRAFDVGDGLALDWQSALVKQSLKTSLISNGHPNKVAHFLKPSAPVFVPGSQATLFPYPRIFVEPRSTQDYQEPSQQYRQQRTHQNVLPTPPSSSSPLWSSNFSPYQGSLYSPDMAPLQLSRIPNNAAHQKQRTSADSSNELRRFVYDRISDAGPANNPSNFSSAAVLQTNQAIKSQPVTARSPDVPHLSRYMQHINLSSSIPISSPLHPGPPPSTPLPPLPAVAHEKKLRLSRSSFAPTPPSPPSPETRPRSVSYQHPRSIPLARLIQRRLSSVPEEDLSSLVERDHAPPPPLSKQLSDAYRTQCRVPHTQILPQRPTTLQHQKQFISVATRTPSPNPTVLPLKSMSKSHFDSGDLDSGLMYSSGVELETECLPAKVKLPHTTLRAVFLEQPNSARQDKAARRMNESKENLMRGSNTFRGSKKKGRGKKIRTSSAINTHVRAPVKGEGIIV